MCLIMCEDEFGGAYAPFPRCVVVFDHELEEVEYEFMYVAREEFDNLVWYSI